MLICLKFICRIFPIIGRGVGPGGSFSLPELHLHSERRSRQNTLNPRTKIGSMEVFSCCYNAVKLKTQFLINPMPVHLWLVDTWLANQLYAFYSLSCLFRVNFDPMIVTKIMFSYIFHILGLRSWNLETQYLAKNNAYTVYICM